MRAKKARAIRRKYGVRHARLAKIYVEREAPRRSTLMAVSRKHLNKLLARQEREEG